MLALCLFLPQSFLLLCIRLLAPCSLLLVFAFSHFTIISCSNNDATMAMMATMCGGGSSRSYITIIMSIWLIMLTTMAAAAGWRGRGLRR